jgi:predicted SAM-dependent methyltransferase
MIKKIVRLLRKHIQYLRFRVLLFVFNLTKRDINIVIGASNISQAGFIPTEAHFLNLLKEENWKKHFSKKPIKNILAEHVWEHLTIEEGMEAAKICYKFMAPEGRLRIAVPDGFHFDSNYINYVKPNGNGAGADDHKVLYNFITLSQLLRDLNFKIQLLEYFDENNQFHQIPWDIRDGFIRRSIRYDKRNTNREPNYTSLILDAIK